MDRVNICLILYHEMHYRAGQKQGTTMKTVKCDLCDATAEGETFEDWMAALRPHYMEAHADVMSDSKHTKEDMHKWMADNKARFDAAG
jgi:hypothetical protein